MEDLDRDKLRDDIVERETAQPGGVGDPDMLEGEARAAYYQGRIDEYASQNAIDVRELTLLEQDVLDS